MDKSLISDSAMFDSSSRWGIARSKLEHLRELEHRMRYGVPQCPPAPAPVTSADLALAAEKLAVKEEAKAERDALDARISNEVALASATGALLGSIRQLLLGEQSTVTPQACFAKFRKELQPLAETYGVKIVCVGDKTNATLVK